MRIRDIHIHAVVVPRVYNTRVAAAGGHIGGKDDSRYYLLEFETDTGLIGLGEISDIEDAWAAPAPAALRETLAAPLLDADPLKRRPTWERIETALPSDYHPEFRNLVTSAVDVALLDLAGKHHHAPAHALLGDEIQEKASDLVGPGLLSGDVVAPRLEYQQGGLGLGVDLVPTLLAQYGAEI